MLKLKQNIKNAIIIGTLCSVSYLAVYIARNILSAVSPQMIKKEVFLTEQVGTLSSVYFICYAIGQLINGYIGDRIKAKYMISFGLILAGLGNQLFAFWAHIPLASYIAYGLTGFFLSMIYGPMTKLVSENTEPIYATRCSLGYTFASFFGSPLAGMLATFLKWQGVFIVGTVALIMMGLICFISFSSLEKKGIIKYNQYTTSKGSSKGIRVLIERQIIKFTLVSVLTGVVRTSVVFWLPTYFSQYLKYSAEKSAAVFTFATLLISMSAFIAVFIYEMLNRNMDSTIMIVFIASAISFLSVYLVKSPIINIFLIVLAIISANCAASMLWSVYCPSLKDTGMVSSATGFLDFMSYMAAAISSSVFANAVSSIGWSGLILVWFGLMIVGVIISLPYRAIKNHFLP